MRIYLLFILAVSPLQSQTIYNFDHIIAFQITWEQSAFENVTYINSRNSNYYMRILKGQAVPASQAIILDFATNMSHFYDVTQKESNGGYEFVFAYRRSVARIQSPEKLKRTYDIKFTGIDSLQAQLKLYKNPKKKVVQGRSILKFSEYPVNLFSAIRHCIMDGALSNFNFSHPKSVVLDAAEVFQNGRKFQYKRTMLEKINISLPMPVQLVN